METLDITKKAFKEAISIHTYGRGKRAIKALFFDWREGDGFRGYKYMVKGYGCTKKDLFNDAYNILTKDDCSKLCWYDMKIAKTDKERFRVPISM
jgi:hypothetical protein